MITNLVKINKRQKTGKYTILTNYFYLQLQQCSYEKVLPKKFVSGLTPDTNGTLIQLLCLTIGFIIVDLLCKYKIL